MRDACVTHGRQHINQALAKEKLKNGFPVAPLHRRSISIAIYAWAGVPMDALPNEETMLAKDAMRETAEKDRPDLTTIHSSA